MRPRLSRVLAAAALCAAVAQAEDRRPGGAEGLAQKEAGLAVTALAGENERLREEVRALKADLEQAREALARAVADLDVERSRAGRVAPGMAKSGAGLTAAEAAVLDASPELGMVVLGLGTGEGVRPGMVFAVLRGDRVVARVRATEVRAGMTGALVDELAAEDNFPRKGDRAVIWRGSQEE